MPDEQEQNDSTEEKPVVKPDSDLDSVESKAASVVKPDPDLDSVAILDAVPDVERRKRQEKRSSTTQEGESRNE